MTAAIALGGVRHKDGKHVATMTQIPYAALLSMGNVFNLRGIDETNVANGGLALSPDGTSDRGARAAPDC